MKVILDETLDHTSWDNDLIAKHPEWYRHDNAPLGTVDHNTSTISRTPYWADVAQLDYDHADLRDYMTQMLRYWVKTFDVDGFRFDSGELMPTEFWNQASTALRAVKPDILLLGESHRPESMVRGFNLDYSFTLYSALSDVLHKKVPASAIKEVWEEEHAAFPRGALHMQYAGNQDTEKPAAAFGVDAARALAVLTFTLDGVPMLYNGAEIDDASPGGFLDGAPIDWAHANAKSEAWYRKLISVREYRHALMSGTVRWVPNEYPDKLLTFIREDGKEQILVIINLSDQPVALNRLRQFNQFDEIDPEGDWTDESPSDWAGHGLAPDTFDGKPFGYAIYVRDKSKASE
jgi:glycosidase